ncbi:MAG: M23 family metallopeptidase [Bacilli bacterium]|nr:M23 family metallopeptidase [Bacilli bacterium]
MKNRRLKKGVVYGIYICITFLVLGTIYYIDLSNKSLDKEKKDEYSYVTKLFDNGIKSVVNTPTTPTVIRPYINNEVKILKNFYDYKGEEKTQENAIINYENTYMQNNGTIYGGINDTFDVVTVLDGNVTSVKEDNLLGKVVTIAHENNIITTYQSLKEVTVKEGDQVTQGMVIGTAGESNLEKNLGNHLLFEITINEANINPETCFDKKITELNN